MGFYQDRVLPHIIDKTCGMLALKPVREQACAPLHGRVIEIGFGSGLNVAVYPDEVAEVSAVEPSEVAWSMAADRVHAAPIRIERSGLDGQRLPFESGTFDAALSTFTLCTIPDAEAALAEVRRVLRPDGVFAFLEHGHAPDGKVSRWQRRLEPIQKRVAGGCHLTRDIRGLVTESGFRLVDVDTFYQPDTPRPFGYLTMGVARPVV